MEVPAPGRHMIYPALTAAAAGMLLGMTGEEIAAGVSAFVQTGMRMKVTRAASGIQIYNDAYNANPQSMRAALQILEQAPGITRRILTALGYDDPLRELDLIRANTTGAALPAIVGRIDEENIDEVVERGPELILVGRAIVGAVAPAQAAADLREHFVSMG